MEEFKSTEQIIEDLLLYQLSESDKNQLKGMTEKDLIVLHHNFGQWIRNHYKLWDMNNPYTGLNYEPVIIEGVDCSEKHPDAVSMAVIEGMWKKLQT